MQKTKFKPRPLSEQVIVITGASSGIGLATAFMAAKAGAKVVLASRNRTELDNIVSRIERRGGSALAVQTDVSKWEDVDNLKNEAIREFGRIDTWINNAGKSIYGDLLETPLEEEKALFETNFWGVRHGCHAAMEAFHGNGGVLINVGSEVSEVAIPLQGMYSATKHAVKAYTDALRVELNKKDSPVYVSLIRPAGIDTPFTEHAVNRLQEGEPSLPAPVYHPDVVARAILKCAVRPQRDVYVGAPSRFFHLMNTFFPSTTDLFLESMFKQQSKGSDTPHTAENEALLQTPHREGKLQGGHKGHVSRSSLYTYATTSAWQPLLTLGLAVLGAVLFRESMNGKKHSPKREEKKAA